jgi:NAD(P)-dependent dehydrogenase (short-subunit alcohol dehydrogenase family)
LATPPNTRPLIFRKGLDMKEAVAGELAAAYHSRIVDDVRSNDFCYRAGRLTLHLAREFAKHGHPLVLVAPVEDELERIATQMRAEFNANVEVIAADLSVESSVEEIWDELSVMGTTVGILCNNAGLGRRGKFWEIPLEDDIQMLRVNAEAVVRMTKRFLPRMLSTGRRALPVTSQLVNPTAASRRGTPRARIPFTVDTVSSTSSNGAAA